MRSSKDKHRERAAEQIRGKLKTESGKWRVESWTESLFQFAILCEEKDVAFGTCFPPLRYRSGPPEVGLPCGMAPIRRKWENPLLSGKLRVESGKLGELKKRKEGASFFN
jgi:hypothetical protein